MERGFSLYDIEQFMREAGAERVSEDAIMDMERMLERLAEKVANKALIYAEHAGRKKLIKRADVMLTRGASHKKIVYRRAAAFRKNAKPTNSISTIHM